MSDPWFPLTGGFIIGLIVAAFAIVIANRYALPNLDQCAREHNVFACHLVAVPSPPST